MGEWLLSRIIPQRGLPETRAEKYDELGENFPGTDPPVKNGPENPAIGVIFTPGSPEKAGTTLAQARAMISGHWLNLIRAEYREMPGLKLTKTQVQRFWGLDPHTCEAVLETLETENFLKRLANAYVLRDISC